MAIFNTRDNNEKPLEKERREPQMYQMEESVTEEERLEDEIRKTETEMDAVYAKIGKEYYEKNPEAPLSDEMSSRFGEIGEKKEKILNINDQIRALKGVIKCEQCGADILNTDTFCSNCGARIISEVIVSSVGGICPSCGHEVKPGQLFCTTCGARVTVSDDIESEKTRIFEPVTKNTPSPKPAEEDISWESFRVPDPEEIEEPGFKTTGSASAGKMRCPKCGEEIEEGMKFCIFCGIPLNVPEYEGDDHSGQQKPTSCPHCGEPLKPDDLFCMNCGTKVR